MRHINPFPFQDFEKFRDERAAFLTKLMCGVLVAPLSNGHTSMEAWAQYHCWLYAGKWEDGRGYKKVKFLGFTFYVHRAVYELIVGPVPAGHILDHLCKNRGCCQPRHLDPITQGKNIERGCNPNWLMRSGNGCSSTGRLVQQEFRMQELPPLVDIPGDHVIVGGDFTEIEKRVVAWAQEYDVDGVIGDQGVTIKTHRPEFWDTPALMQAHIDHGHPRFRTPSWANQNDVPRALPDGTVYIPYSAKEKENLAAVRGAYAPARPPRRMTPALPSFPRRLGLFFRMLWRGDFLPPARPVGTPTDREIGEL